MANELNTNITFSVNKNNILISGVLNKSNDMSGTELISNVQTIGESAGEALQLGDITGVPGGLFVRNLDETNYVELALDSNMTQKFAKLLPGQGLVLPPAVAAIYAKANTAACPCHVVACEA